LQLPEKFKHIVARLYAFYDLWQYFPKLFFGFGDVSKVLFMFLAVI